MKNQRQEESPAPVAGHFVARQLRAELERVVLAFAEHLGMLPCDKLEITIKASWGDAYKLSSWPVKMCEK